MSVDESFSLSLGKKTEVGFFSVHGWPWWCWRGMSAFLRGGLMNIYIGMGGEGSGRCWEGRSVRGKGF